MRTRIFFSVNNTDFLSCPEFSNYRISITRNIADSHGFSFTFLVPNFRIIEFCLHTEYHGLSRIFFSSFLVTNYRISITRNITDSHGFSFFFVPNYRIIEFCLHTEYRGRSRIFFFSSCHELSRLVLGPTDQREVIIEFLSSVILRDSPCDYKKIRKFSNS